MAVDMRMSFAPAPMMAFAEHAERYLLEYPDAPLSDLTDGLKEVFQAPGALSSLVNSYLQTVLDDPAFSGDGLVGESLFTLWYSDILALRLVRDRVDVFSFSPKTTTNTLASYSSDALVMFMRPGVTMLDWYRLADGASFDRVDETLEISHHRTEHVEPGDVVFVNAALEFPNFEILDGDYCIVLTARKPVAQVVSFDAQSLRPLGASMACITASTLCTMLDLTRELSASAPIEPLSQLAHHKDHHVRWSATRALWRHDRSAAVNVMQALASKDPHPFVRRAAKAGLAQAEAIDVQT